MLKHLLFLLLSLFKSRQTLALENIALRHQLDVLQRNAKRPRLKPSDRILWALFSPFLPNWRQNMTIVQPDTVIRWHRSGWRLYWRWRCRTVHTATFKTLYVFLVLSLARRKIIHFNVTTNPTAEWTSLQLTQAFPFGSAPRYLIRDRDGIYSQKVIDTIKNLGVKQVVVARQSPWQNGFCERVIGSIRRECLDHIIVLNDRHLRRVLKEYFADYHEARTHLGLKKDAPVSRPVQRYNAGPMISEPVLGGLHHRYFRDAA